MKNLISKLNSNWPISRTDKALIIEILIRYQNLNIRLNKSVVKAKELRTSVKKLREVC